MNDFNAEPNTFIFEFTYTGDWDEIWIEFPLESRDRVPLFKPNLGLKNGDDRANDLDAIGGDRVPVVLTNAAV
jgi:hypothetical protein